MAAPCVTPGSGGSGDDDNSECDAHPAASNRTANKVAEEEMATSVNLKPKSSERSRDTADRKVLVNVEEVQSARHPGACYVGAINSAKHQLQVCLKLLGILYRTDDQLAHRDKSKEKLQDSEVDVATTLDEGLKPEGSQVLDEEEVQALKADSRADKLYLAMVMLNSALLKALHVADSFQMHCHREFPKVVPPNTEGHSTKYLLNCENSMTTSTKVSGGEYRRLQAECVMQWETVRSLEIQRDSDKARINQLDDECRSLRQKIQRQRELRTAPPSTSSKNKASDPSPKAETAECGFLENLGLAMEHCSEDGVLITESERQRIDREVQNLKSIVREAREGASGAAKHADTAERHSHEAMRERKELQQLLGVSGGDKDELLKAARRLVEEMQAEERAVERINRSTAGSVELQNAGAATPPDLSSMEGNTAALPLTGTPSAQQSQREQQLWQQQQQLQRVRKGDATPERRYAGGQQRSPVDYVGAGISSTSGIDRGGEHASSIGQVDDMQDLLQDDARPSSRTRGTQVQGRPIGQEGSGANVHSRKPFVVSSSAQSHHATAHSAGRQTRRTASSGNLHEDRQSLKPMPLRVRGGTSDMSGRSASLIGSSSCSSLLLGSAAAAAASAAAMGTNPADSNPLGNSIETERCQLQPAPFGAPESVGMHAAVRASALTSVAAGSAEVPAMGAMNETCDGAAKYATSHTTAIPVPTGMTPIASGGSSPPVPTMGWDIRQTPRSPSPQPTMLLAAPQQIAGQVPRQQSPNQSMHFSSSQSPRSSIVPAQRSQSPPQPGGGLNRFTDMPSTTIPLSVASRASAAAAAGNQDFSPPTVGSHLGGPGKHIGMTSVGSRGCGPSWPVRTTWPLPEHRAQFASAAVTGLSASTGGGSSNVSGISGVGGGVRSSPLRQRPRRPAQPAPARSNAWA